MNSTQSHSSTYLKDVMRKLLVDYPTFFSKNGIVNSEGRKLLENIIKALMNEYPFYRRFLHKVRREPTLENILKLARLIMDDSELSELTSNYDKLYVGS